ncbi:H-NS histone family protein [Xylella fastidiosa]|uniref:H-NS histone family protein n=2 Tax=Xylella fastidiosa TaxID=2371 RepID=A0ABC8ACI1_XYLFS|nr:H-NS family nucleoid-associated regulatory protein [Xylella fastidiosa]AAF84302.1 virulence regulator [Xylella fastidiosa 9a5c]ALQ94829.1 histone-like nucleoid-structuring protein [Xylella fastidiosa]ALQ97188.1 H-NS histone family protein [Xylella fastidiosa]ALR02099.1 histone-like nucleoid-structuring protein [Xylella fastidiosa]ALR04335.1 H-NS histone family protein [Xylella fastidiosa]
MIDNNVLNLDAIAEAKVKLTEELRRLEEQEVQLLQQQAAEMFTRVIALLNDFGKHFNGKQKAEIAALIMVNDEKPKARKALSADARRVVVPKYCLPHSGETWTGRGRLPSSFAAWEGTAAYKEWKSNHPNERFPAFQG